MQYSLEKVNTVAVYDALLVMAEKQKCDLERRRRNLGEAIETLRERIDLIGNESLTVQSLLEACKTAYHTLPDGSRDRVSMNVDIKRLELRQARLDRRAYSANARTLLAKEVYYNRLGSQVSAIASFIVAVQRKRAALNQADRQVPEVALASRTTVPRQRTRLTAMPGRARFHSPPVVQEKYRPEKSLYSFQAHFSGSRDCTCKTAPPQRHVQFSSA